MTTAPVPFTADLKAVHRAPLLSRFAQAWAAAAKPESFRVTCLSGTESTAGAVPVCRIVFCLLDRPGVIAQLTLTDLEDGMGTEMQIHYGKAGDGFSVEWAAGSLYSERQWDRLYGSSGLNQLALAACHELTGWAQAS